MTRVDRLGPGPRGRVSLEFDVVELKAASAVAAWIASRQTRTLRHFGLVRTLSTERRLISALSGLPKTGQWFELKLSRERGVPGLPAWLSPLQANGFTSTFRGRIVSATPLATGHEGEETLGPTTPSAASVPTRYLPREISKACSLTNIKSLNTKSAAQILTEVPRPHRIRIRDVGQASFITLENEEGKAIMHFDAGIPTPFNAHTVTKRVLKKIRIDPAPVLISHWDWDHIHAGLSFSVMQKLEWVAPDQPIGPSAARLAQMLAAQGTLAIWPQGKKLRFSFGLVAQCNGKSNLNDSGIAVRVSLAKKYNALLPGDAAHKVIPTSLRRRLTALVCTHHGGKLAPLDTPPKPIPQRNILIISCGHQNIYEHPDSNALRCYRNAGWTSHQYTKRVAPVPRGDRFLP